MILRLNAQGDVITEGEQVVIGGNDMYSSTCRKHFKRREPGCMLTIKERTEDLV